VPIGLGRYARVAVAEDALHRGGVHAGHHEQASCRVAEVVEKVTGGTPSLPKYLLAAALDRARKQLGIK